MINQQLESSVSDSASHSSSISGDGTHFKKRNDSVHSEESKSAAVIKSTS